MNDVLQRRCPPPVGVFEASLSVYDSGYSGTCILVGDDHLPGTLPSFEHVYFLEHLQKYYYVV